MPPCTSRWHRHGPMHEHHLLPLNDYREYPVKEIRKTAEGEKPALLGKVVRNHLIHPGMGGLWRIEAPGPDSYVRQDQTGGKRQFSPSTTVSVR